VSIKSLLFIDANQYLNLYQMLHAKTVLAALEEQQAYIFVTEQIVDEVYRRKLGKAGNFFAEQLKKWEGIAFPDHLLDITDKSIASKYEKLREIAKQPKDAKEEFRELASDLLRQVSQSKDDISKRLAGIFAKAVPHSPEELKRAQERREHGNPPGKATDPLGDQLSWEQLLSRCQSNRGLWIVTGDLDFATKHAGRMILNAKLYKDLVTRTHPAEPEVFCFDNLPDGLKNFVQKNRLKATKLPTPEEAEQIKKEQELLPIFDWTNYDDSANYQAVLAYREREAAQMRVAAMSQAGAEPII
jgi:PIN like domain